MILKRGHELRQKRDRDVACVRSQHASFVDQSIEVGPPLSPAPYGSERLSEVGQSNNGTLAQCLTLEIRSIPRPFDERRNHEPKDE